MHGGETGVQLQQHQALQTMCSRSTRTELDDDAGKKGPIQAMGNGCPIKRTSGVWVGQLTDRVGNCLGRGVIGQAWPALEDLRVA